MEWIDSGFRISGLGQGFRYSDFEFIASTQTPDQQSNAYGVIRTSRAGGLMGLIIEYLHKGLSFSEALKI